jgi:uncharacterized protein YbjQ (UPF0145 family)
MLHDLKPIGDDLLKKTFGTVGFLMPMQEKTVSVAVVKTRHVYADLFQWVRNLLGMNLIAYESLIEEATNEAIAKLEAKYPDVEDVHIGTAQISNGAAEIIAYGKIWVPDHRHMQLKRVGPLYNALSEFDGQMLSDECKAEEETADLVTVEESIKNDRSDSKNIYLE